MASALGHQPPNSEKARTTRPALVKRPQHDAKSQPILDQTALHQARLARAAVARLPDENEGATDECLI